MKGLATFVMRGPSQAALVAAVMALLSVLAPPLALLSAAAIGLVSLREGTLRGLLVGTIATLGLGALAWLSLGSPWAAAGVLVMLWMPTLGLAAVLRSTRSLALAVQLAGVLGILVLLLVHAFVADPAAGWLQVLEPFREALVKDGLVAEGDSAAVFMALSRWMTGAFAAALVFQWLLGLFIARWWQAVLYNPGGFGEEFRALGVGRVFGGLTLALLALLPFVDGGNLATEMLLVTSVLLLLQGLAVAHQARARRQARGAWLVGLYVLVVLFMPQSLILLACVGLIDIWADIRARVAPRGPSTGASD